MKIELASGLPGHTDQDGPSPLPVWSLSRPECQDNSHHVFVFFVEQSLYSAEPQVTLSSLSSHSSTG